MSFPSKADREVCWKARDEYWKCLDLNKEDKDACLKWREEFQNSCSSSWVKYFDKRRKYEKFKAELDEINWEIPTKTKT